MLINIYIFRIKTNDVILITNQLFVYSQNRKLIDV